MKKIFLVAMLLPIAVFAKEPKQNLIKIVEVSKKEKTTIVLAQDKKLGWVEMNEKRKSFKKDSIRNMEISLIDFVWDYKFKQNISSVKCEDYVEVHLLSTDDMARVCRTDIKNMSVVQPYIKWARRALI